jgi:hypothetical protein
LVIAGGELVSIPAELVVGDESVVTVGELVPASAPLSV